MNCDAKLSEQLQLDAELTLEKAMTKVRQSESVKKQQDVIRASAETTQVARVKSNQVWKDHKKLGSYTTARKFFPAEGRKRCHRCGKVPEHSKSQCPAQDCRCKKCGRMGHFAQMCKTKKVSEIHVSEKQYLDCITKEISSVTNSSSKHEPWTVTLLVDEVPINFKIDTGADVNVLPENIARNVFGTRLKKSIRCLKGPNQKPLEVCGQIKCKLEKGSQSVKEELYVIKGLRKPLVGLPTIKALKLITRVDQVDVDHEMIDKHPKLFSGLGVMKRKYKIELKENAQPYALSTPRRIPIPLLPKVKEELVRMEKDNVIQKVEEPTDWVAGMVVVPKQNGKVRICVDLTQLNKCVKRERDIMPSVDHVLAQLENAVVFSKLDANSGYWQILLTQECAPLTTFITPFGRYFFKRLPFGITSAPEVFQKRISQILENLKGVICLMDDILVFGTNQQEHDCRLEAVLGRLQEAGVTLNKEKCLFSKRRIKFLGHVIDSHGISSDPDKVSAILNLKEPRNRTDIRSFLGMVNQQSKFVKELATLTEPLRALLCGRNAWIWDDRQRKAVAEIKKRLSEAPVLAVYNPERETRVASDASSVGLVIEAVTRIGAVIEQKQSNGIWRAIAYASRSLTPCERKYAQIGKESLASVWACEKFSCYLVGKTFTLLTDYKPLLTLFGRKELDELPPRIQRFRMRLMRYEYKLDYVPGKELGTADTLSRYPVDEPTEIDHEFVEIVETWVNQVMDHIPASDKRLEQVRQMQKEDWLCQQVRRFTDDGWPEKRNLHGELKKFAALSSEITVQRDILVRGSRLIIPDKLRREMIERIHEGHQGIVKCRERAKAAIWWPGMSKELKEYVFSCPVCSRERRNHIEPLITTPLPLLPWQKIGTDLFEFKGSHYLLVIDYFSRYIEVVEVRSMTSVHIIKHLKAIFSRHGVPECVVSDNGTQYTSEEFNIFANEYGFKHVTSSPKYPKANGEAERAVKTVKTLLQKAKDPYLALLSYRTTPLSNGFSSSQLLMSRRLRSNLPMSVEQRKPEVPNMQLLRKREVDQKRKKKVTYDKRHKVQHLPLLKAGDSVWISDKTTTGTVLRETYPRSYLVSTPKEILRRNRNHIRIESEEERKMEGSEEERKMEGSEERIERRSEPEREQRTNLESNVREEDHQPCHQYVGNQGKTSQNTSEMQRKERENTLETQRDLVATQDDHRTIRTRSGRQVRKPNRLDL